MPWQGSVVLRRDEDVKGTSIVGWDPTRRSGQSQTDPSAAQTTPARYGTPSAIRPFEYHSRSTHVRPP